MSFTTRMYALADAFGMAVDCDADGKLTGARIKKWKLEGTTFEFSQKIVSSGTMGAHIGAIAKVAGNLAVLMTVDELDQIECRILNLAHLPKVSEFFEKESPKDLEECLNRLGSAVVAAYSKVNKTSWKPLAV